MNVFGMDYGRTSSFVVLREGNAAIRPVGDGLRTLIPHAARASDGNHSVCWGSHVVLPQVCTLARATPERVPLETPSQRRNDAFLENDLRTPATVKPLTASLVPGAWTDEPEAALFWTGLQDRLFRYLGRMTATEANGYRIVVAISAGSPADAPQLLASLARRVGLEDIDVIYVTDALVSQFLASPAGSAMAAQASDTESLVAVAVALGDTATDVRGYRLTPQLSVEGEPVLRAEPNARLADALPYGHAHWVSRLLDTLAPHLREPLTSEQELLLRDAALEHGAALRRATTDDAFVPWTGPFRDRMYAPLRLRVHDCLTSWPEAQRLVAELPERIREAARAAGDADGIPDILLLGGVGACWPFAFRAAELLRKQDGGQKLLIWSSDTAEEDVARGASWWPEFGSTTLPAWRGDSSFTVVPSAVVRKAPEPKPSTAKPTKVRPPAVPSEATEVEKSDAVVSETPVPPSLRRLDF